MAMSDVTLVLYTNHMFNYTGKVGRWANTLERNYVRNAKVMAPVRSGELKEGIFGETMKIGPKEYEIHIHSDAEHTLYVLQGTQGPIMSDAAWAAGGELPPWGQRQGHFMSLRPGNGHGHKIRHKVSGQRANNFFGKAHNATARQHSSLRPGGMDMMPNFYF